MLWFWAVPAFGVTLEEAWEASESAVDLRLAGESAEAADARIAQARALLLPKVVASAGWTVNDEQVALDFGKYVPAELAAMMGPTEPIVVQPKDYAQASITLAQPLFDADAWATLSAAAHGAKAADADVEDARRRVRLGVAEAFYGVVLAREAVGLSEEARAVAIRQEEVAGALVDAGSAPPRTLLEAQQARWAAERDVMAAVEQRTRAEEAWHRVTGLPKDAVLDRAGRDAGPTARDAGPTGQGRPDLVAAEERAQAARAARLAAGLGWIPDVTASVTTVQTENKGFAEDGQFTFGAVQASWTFDGGYRAARAREASATARQAEVAVERAQLVAEEEAANARAGAERAAAAVLASEKQIAAAQEALKQAEAAFAQGGLAFVEVERAALGLRAARLAQLSDQLAVELAGIRVALVTP